MSLINKGSRTGAALETWLADTLGVRVDLATNSATAIAYAANNLVLRQRETVTVSEFRGLDKATALDLEALDSDTTTTTVYYHEIDASGDYAAVGITTGTATDYAATRDDEGDAWRVTKTVRTFAAANVGTGSNAWTTTRPSAATSTGVQISHDKRTSFLFTADSDTLYSTEETTVTEYRFLTKSEADTKVSNNTASGMTYHTYKHTGTTVYYYPLLTGTDKTASARYVDAANGYTVSVVERTITPSGTNWAQYA